MLLSHYVFPSLLALGVVNAQNGVSLYPLYPSCAADPTNGLLYCCSQVGNGGLNCNAFLSFPILNTLNFTLQVQMRALWTNEVIRWPIRPV